MRLVMILLFLFLLITSFCDIDSDIKLMDKLYESCSDVTDGDFIYDSDGKRKTLSESTTDISILRYCLSKTNSITIPDSSSSVVIDAKNTIMQNYYIFFIKSYFSIGDTQNTIQSYKKYKKIQTERTPFYYRFVTSKYIQNDISINELKDLFSLYNTHKSEYQFNSFIIFSLLIEKDLDSIEYQLSQIDEEMEFPKMITLFESHVNIIKKNYQQAITHWKLLEGYFEKSPWSVCDDLFILEEEYLIKELENSQNEFLVCLLLKHVDEFDRSKEYFEKYFVQYKLTTEKAFRDFVSAKYGDEVVKALMEYYKEVKN